MVVTLLREARSSLSALNPNLFLGLNLPFRMQAICASAGASELSGQW